MIVITQRPIHVDTDKLIAVRQYEDTDPADTEFYDTFIIEHECVGNGMFKVSVSPYSYDQESIMCEIPSAFTVDFDALKDIYEHPSDFILNQVLKYDARYELSDDFDDRMCGQDQNTDKTDLINTDPFNLDDIPPGSTVVSYMDKDGRLEDVVIYSDDPKYVFTNEQKLKFDEKYGVGNYRIMDAKAAKLYIKQREKELDKKNEEFCKNNPEAVKNWNPFIGLFK